MAAKVILTAVIGFWLFFALKRVLKDLKSGRCPGCGNECGECKKRKKK